MNGPEHYAEAERLGKITENRGVENISVAERQVTAVVAQMHATLALTAATIMGLSIVGSEEPWKEVLK
jgi:hypothetical protein